MSEGDKMENEVVSEILQRFDAIAAKFGIAAERVWVFSVAAKVVEARRDIIQGFCQLLFVALSWGYSLFIYSMDLPREYNGHDLTTGGYVLVGSAIVGLIIGGVILWSAIYDTSMGYASAQTTEKDAFDDLMHELRKLKS